MNKKKGILFDMDGTLLNSLEEEAMKKVLFAFQNDEQTLILQILKQNVNSYSDFERVLYQQVSKQKADAISATIEQVLHKHYEDVTLIKDASKFLQYTKEKGYHLCLCTNNSLPIVSKILKDKALTSYFDVVITSQDVTFSKPDPTMFLKAMNNLQLSKEECIIFEDSSVGVKAAHNAGIDCIVVNHTKKDDEFYHIQDYSDPYLYTIF